MSVTFPGTPHLNCHSNTFPLQNLFSISQLSNSVHVTCGFGNEANPCPHLALVLSSCVTLGNLVNLSGSPYPHLKSKDCNNLYLIDSYLSGQSKTKCLKPLS